MASGTQGVEVHRGPADHRGQREVGGGRPDGHDAAGRRARREVVPSPTNRNTASDAGDDHADQEGTQPPGRPLQGPGGRRGGDGSRRTGRGLVGADRVRLRGQWVTKTSTAITTNSRVRYVIE